MPVKIRLKRRGRKKLAMFDVVVADSRSPRDGKFIERIGTYNPNTDPATIELNEEKAFDWVMKGAQPSDTVRAMLSYRGILLKKHLQIGVLKGAITQEDAEKKFDAWVNQKDKAIENKKTGLADKADKQKQERLDAERKVSEARAESIRKRKEDAVEALKEEISGDAENAEEEVESETAEAPAQEAIVETAVVEEKKEEAPVETAVVEEKKEDAPTEEVKAEAATSEESEEKKAE
jgi:small subunit ribosomal protein S16